MFQDISPEMAGLVGNWCNTLLYGITVITYLLCMHLLILRRDERRQTATWILSGTSTIQFILATINVAAALQALIDGFIHTENLPRGAYNYWINPAIKPQVISNVAYITNSVVGDLVLIWRLYMVWGKNVYVCVLPVMLTCCTAEGTVTGYVTESKIAAISSNLQPSTLFEILDWEILFRCLSIAPQLISTSLIAGMIVWHARRNPVAKSRYVPLIVIIGVSGAIYTISAIVLLAFIVLKTEAGEILAQMITQITTIVPTLVIIRVELTRGTGITSRLTSGSQNVTTHPINFGSGHREQDLSVQVTVSSLTASDSQKELQYGV
ncbi:hypothetical protein D9619_011082 [Psilocybe cf. subviscida]|uniref:Uncharacterized protein n=1 Tax=Psilocybe cf. subviscida TaxID=2480587 RepID=A0A8H5F596_9AGAR|nr:hypothetical protein D9619_011082 [Psilocybe cf. subviscida]